MDKKRSYRAKKPKEKIETKNEYFPTYHGLTYSLLDNIGLEIASTILEPCSGNSDIIKAIKEKKGDKYNFIQYDINPRNNNIKQADFLKLKPEKVDYIITNPPFTLFLDFLIQSSKWQPKEIYMIAPLDYLHGSERFEKIYNNGFNDYFLKTVFVFERRPNFEFAFNHDPKGKIPTGATSFAWFHFSYKYYGDPKIKFLKIKEFMGTPTHKDQLSLL